MNEKTAFLARHVSHDSLKVHRAGVKHETAENCIDIEEKKNSLSSFSYSPVPPPTRVCVRPRGCWGETRATCPSSAGRGSRRRSPGLAHVRPAACASPCLPPFRPNATVGHPLAHGLSATLAERKTSGEPANGSFPAEILRRGTREQPPYRAEFVFAVRTSPGDFRCPIPQPNHRAIGIPSSFPRPLGWRDSSGALHGSPC